MKYLSFFMILVMLPFSSAVTIQSGGGAFTDGCTTSSDKWCCQSFLVGSFDIDMHVTNVTFNSYGDAGEFGNLTMFLYSFSNHEGVDILASSNMTEVDNNTANYTVQMSVYNLEPNQRYMLVLKPYNMTGSMTWWGWSGNVYPDGDAYSYLTSWTKLSYDLEFFVRTNSSYVFSGGGGGAGTGMPSRVSTKEVVGEVWSAILSGANWGQVLPMWNPPVADEISELWSILFLEENQPQLLENVVELGRLMILYILREPATITQIPVP